MRITGSREMCRLPAAEGVVEDVAGPDEDGTAWCVTLRLRDGAARDSLALYSEADLETTGLAEDEGGKRVPLAERPPAEERRDCLHLLLATAITDNIVAARVAEEIEQELHDLIGAGRIEIEAERHWAEPFNYELEVTIEPLDDPAVAFRRIAEAGGEAWISCRDDGWRCDLWWCATDDDDDDAVFLVPEIRGAEVAFLPWRSPRRRPEAERPLVTVDVPALFEEEALDDEAGDEEA